MQSLNLVTVVGHNITMLPHMLDYYKDIVDNIFVVVYRQNEDDGILDEIEKLAEEISKYGYISSVRKAIKILNTDNKMKKKFIVDIKNENKPETKVNYHCKIRTGLFRYDMLNCKLEVLRED